MHDESSLLISTVVDFTLARCDLLDESSLLHSAVIDLPLMQRLRPTEYRKAPGAYAPGASVCLTQIYLVNSSMNSLYTSGRMAARLVNSLMLCFSRACTGASGILMPSGSILWGLPSTTL